jgi:hypothetical protein
MRTNALPVDVPTFKVKGLAGFAVTPAGRPVIETSTCPEKPFFGVTLTVTALLVLPCATVTDGEEKETEKSGTGGGG